MGLGNLQAFIETHGQQACKSVDLVQEARLFGQQARASQRRGSHQLRLVVDAECCLNKLYGGFYSDWACGGQWNRMLGHLSKFVQTCRASNIELTVFFNGTLELQRMDDWYQVQLESYKRVQSIVRHVQITGLPPPKVLWVAPPMIRSCLRLALRQLGVTVACSMDDHHQEVIGYCRENDFSGLLAHDCDYIIFNPPRYFSAHHLKMTFKGTLETQEYMIDDLAKAVDLHPQRFCILAALLGTHILPESELGQFYRFVCHLSAPVQRSKCPPSDVIRAVIAYVRSLESVEDLDAVGATVFSNCSGNVNDKVNRFKQSVQYYVNGTKDGYFKYRPKFQISPAARQPGSYPSIIKPKDAFSDEQVGKNGVGKESSLQKIFVTEDTNVMNGASSSGYSSSSMLLHVDGAASLARRLADVKLEENASSYGSSTQPKTKSVSFNDMVVTQVLAEKEAVQQTKLPAKPPSAVDNSAPCPTSKTSRTLTLSSVNGDRSLPRFVSADVMHIASERNQKGLMCSWVYQLLAQGEIKLPVSLEDETNAELPHVIDLYRPLRQRVYSVLFNLSERTLQWKQSQGTPEGNKSSKPSVSIKEWQFPHHGGCLTVDHGRRAWYDTVQAEPLEFAVPGLQRLWLGTSTEDKSYRLKTFLSCMQCDTPQNMLINVSYVPQQFMLFCCVVRYILQYQKQRILRPYELDAILATAVSPLLQHAELLQDIMLPAVRMRGIHLASLLMNGVEHAIFVNDAIGAPIPWGVACPWLFFDGKVFHMKLLQAGRRVPLFDLCDRSMEQSVCVEKMRAAILHGIDPSTVFSFPPPRPLMDWQPPSLQPGRMDMHSAGGEIYPYHGGGYDSMDTVASISDLRGGMLEIAGVVVGSWGPNTALARSSCYGPQSLSSLSVPPRIMSVGPHSAGSGMMMTVDGIRPRFNRKNSKKKKNKKIKQQENVTPVCVKSVIVESSSNTNLPVLHLMKNTHSSLSAELSTNNKHKNISADEHSGNTHPTDLISTCRVDVSLNTDKVSTNENGDQSHPKITTNQQKQDTAHNDDTSINLTDRMSTNRVEATSLTDETASNQHEVTAHVDETRLANQNEDISFTDDTSTVKNPSTSRGDMSLENNFTTGSNSSVLIPTSAKPLSVDANNLS